MVKKTTFVIISNLILFTGCYSSDIQTFPKNVEVIENRVQPISFIHQDGTNLIADVFSFIKGYDHLIIMDYASNIIQTMLLFGRGYIFGISAKDLNGDGYMDTWIYL